MDATSSYSTVSSAPPKKRSGRTKFRETRHPVYKGVRRRGTVGGRKDRWVCEVREPNTKSRIWVGTFHTPEIAARAHDVAAMALRGPSACLNFADSAWLLTVPSPSEGPRAIQRAAAEAARAFQVATEASAREEEEESMDLSSAEVAGGVPEMPAEDGDRDIFDMMEFDLEMRMGGYRYYATMAEWLLLDPPPPVAAGCGWDDVDGTADLLLWSY